MGECIMVRTHGAEEQLPMTSEHCTVVVTCKTQGGVLLGDIPISCNDGGNVVTYNTNAAGKTYFMTNSGIPNFNAPNKFIDSTPINLKNVEGQVASIKKVTLWYNHISNTMITKTSNGNVMFSPDVNNVDVCCYGGGGGGGYGGRSSSTWRAGGGGGYMNYSNEISVSSNTNYQIIIGAGGISNTNGGTSSFIDVYAVGGGGGINNKAGKGGSGNGGYWNGSGFIDATNSNAWAFNNKSLNIIYGGGGALGQVANAGTPGGGVWGWKYESSYSTYWITSPGRAGGGGGTVTGSFQSNMNGGSGGAGVVIFNIHYK